MKTLLVTLVLSVFAVSVLSDTDGESRPSDKITTPADPQKQNGREIKKLQWHAPPGELPGQYDDYLKDHPIIAPRATTVIGDADYLGEDFSILVDATLYPFITSSIDHYISDLEIEGHTVLVHTMSGGSPQDIKDWVMGRYSAGCEGFVFIGDITAAWAEVSGDQFPCDLFYMDLDGNWEDNNSDGVYEIHTAGTGDMAPEVFIGRIYTHSLTYDTEANMANNYFSKTFDYRDGILTQPWRGLEYVEEDWWDMAVNLDLVFDDSLARYDYGYYTTGADYLDQLGLGQYFATVCAHSYSGGHHFGTRPTESAAYGHVYVYSPTTRSARLLMGSDDGIRTWLNGALVLTDEGIGYWVDDYYVADVTLESGWNRLLCKVSQAGGDFQFSARFTDLAYSTFTDLEYQINDPDVYPAEAGFVRSWLLNGFHEDVSGNFWDYLTTNYLGVTEGSINPSAGELMGGKTWTEVNSAYPYIEMSDDESDDFGVSYAFVEVNSATSLSCQLWLGYEDGCRAWLNGTEVLYDNIYGGFEVDRSKIDVALNAGENRLLVKVSEWMGGHGFCARFCQSDGSPVSGLTYDPSNVPIARIGTWLINGPYLNPDEASRLTTDYLGGEEAMRPSQDDAAPTGVWERCIGDGSPLDIGVFYNGEGDWVYSSTIQEHDPPVLSYNLFSCGPGRFTDENYLAGSYIFNTATGLITVASAKSGSMLNFHDFTGPLSENKSIGRAYLEWFQAQAPFELWEQEWYYGLVLNGDPVLHLSVCVDSDGDGYGDPGYPDNPCLTDNCPDDYNPDQTDTDGDDIGDVCEGCCIPPTVGDIDQSGGVDITDISVLIDNQFLTLTPLVCESEGDVDFSGAIDITDVSVLIDNQFLTLAPLPPCP